MPFLYATANPGLSAWKSDSDTKALVNGRVATLMPADLLVGTTIGAATETFFPTTYTIAANSLAVNDRLKITSVTSFPNTVGATTAIARFYLGPMPGLDAAVTDVINGDGVLFSLEVYIKTIGAGGSAVAMLAKSTIGSTSGTTNLSSVSGLFALDTSVPILLRSSLELSAADATTGRLDLLAISLD